MTNQFLEADRRMKAEYDSYRTLWKDNPYTQLDIEVLNFAKRNEILAGDAHAFSCWLAAKRSGAQFRAIDADDEEMPRPEAVLRRILAYRCAGANLYADDGELQDNTAHPAIDFKRDSVDAIESKLGERARAMIAAPVLDAVGVEKPQHSKFGSPELQSVIVVHAAQPAASPAPTDAEIPISDERVKFEAWFAEAYAQQKVYGADEEVAWIGWQARGQQQAGVADGFVVVPKMPTQAMIDNIAAFVDHNENDAEIIYRAMIAAAPSVPGEA